MLSRQIKRSNRLAHPLPLNQLLDDNSIPQYGTIKNPLVHIALQHQAVNDDGDWITLAKKEGGKYRQHHYRLKDIPDVIGDYQGYDAFMSMSSFYKPTRTADSVRYIKSLWSDIDIPNGSHDAAYDLLMNLDADIFGYDLPMPSRIHLSGRGLQVIWTIDPIKEFRKDDWYHMMRHIHAILEPYGADSSCIDLARIFRIAGSINSKNNSLVVVQERDRFSYDIHKLIDEFVPVAEPIEIKGTPKRKQPAKVKNLYNDHSLYYARAMDLEKLIEIRDGACTGYRELILFLYRYFYLSYTGDPDIALEATERVNERFESPLRTKSIRMDTESAERAWKGQKEHTHGGYRYTNKRLIELLDITPVEQTRLTTIIGPDERRTRNRLRMREAHDMQPLEDYKAGRIAQKRDKLDRLLQAIKDDPAATNKQLAAVVGISLSYLKKLKREIK